MSAPADRELKKGSAELLVLSLVESRARHGYEIGKLIDARSKGALHYNVASLYPLLYRLEKRGWLKSEWGLSEANQRAKYYRLTAPGKAQLSRERDRWAQLVGAIGRIMNPAPAAEE